jgi:hypothetical protein
MTDRLYLRCVSCGWVHYAAGEGEAALDCCFKCKGLDFQPAAAQEVPRGVTILPLRLPRAEDFERDMEVARAIMKKRWNVFRKLAKL